MANILIIDDDPEICRVLARLVGKQGHQAHSVQMVGQGLARAQEGFYDLIFLDLQLPDGQGLDFLPTLKAVESSPEVIIITGTGDPQAAKLAYQNGAWAFVAKPFVVDEVLLPMSRALQYRQEKLAKPPRVLKRQSIVGNSPEITACLELVAQASLTKANVLITGETGTGKELFARAIHENSNRAEGRFVVVDCTALPETLVESLLFGHVRGAFTGAGQSREGLVLQADGGTLFLDEVGELPLPVQKSLLRVLQERRFLPLGAKQEVTSDFRLVAATNRDLERMTRQGDFRADLLYRLCAVSISLPPLRHRVQDVQEMTVTLLARLCEQYGMDIKGYAPEFMEAIKACPWPGNIRQLINTLEAALAAAGDHPTLHPIHLPASVRLRQEDDQPPTTANPAQGRPPDPEPPHDDHGSMTLKEFRQRQDRRYLGALMEKTAGNVRKASKLADISESRLHALLKQHEIKRPGSSGE